MMRLVLGLMLALALTACSRSSRPRCSECGMFADVAPAFASGSLGASGAELAFDAPRCLFRYRIEHPGVSRDAWVTEYYSHRHTPIDDVSFVVGSDVLGPMGRDFIPVETANAARFIADHGGTALRAAAIDAHAIRQLDP